MAAAVLDVGRQRSLLVPDDLSVISFDNTPKALFSQPPLTAIDQPIAATAARAAELLIAAKRGDKLPTTPTVVPAELIVRGSTGPAPRRG